eukprot:TRINITY_DN7293_c0_g1_i1.p1 TRINITY_DN7293_c0_g1~~TRINITY_DN7293_c0_g1_i1.p1  ORF type:complete len:267 (+),score=27.20 TRINITY_DN7293_c0_g1_i1:23-802(+)
MAHVFGLSIAQFPVQGVCLFAMFFAIVFFSARYLFSLFEFYNKFSIEQKNNWDGRYLSLVHAIINTIGSVYVFLIEAELVYDDIYKTTEASWLISTIACGYFSFDLVLSIIHFNTFGWQFLLHAVYCGITYFVACAPAFHYFTTFFLLFESSTIFLDLYYMSGDIVVVSEKPSSGLVLFNTISSYVFALVFFIVRILCGNYFSYLFLSFMWANWNEMTLWVWGFLGSNTILSSALNFFWLAEIIKAAVGPTTPDKPKSN